MAIPQKSEQLKTLTKIVVRVKPFRGGWKVKTDGKRRAAKIVRTQAEGIQVGRRIAMNCGAELIVYRADETIRSKDNFGSDPFPPRT